MPGPPGRDRGIGGGGLGSRGFSGRDPRGGRTGPGPGGEPGNAAAAAGRSMGAAAARGRSIGGTGQTPSGFDAAAVAGERLPDRETANPSRRTTQSGWQRVVSALTPFDASTTTRAEGDTTTNVGFDPLGAVGGLVAGPVGGLVGGLVGDAVGSDIALSGQPGQQPGMISGIANRISGTPAPSATAVAQGPVGNQAMDMERSRALAESLSTNEPRPEQARTPTRSPTQTADAITDRMALADQLRGQPGFTRARKGIITI